MRNFFKKYRVWAIVTLTATVLALWAGYTAPHQEPKPTPTPTRGGVVVVEVTVTPTPQVIDIFDRLSESSTPVRDGIAVFGTECSVIPDDRPRTRVAVVAPEGTYQVWYLDGAPKGDIHCYLGYVASLNGASADPLRIQRRLCERRTISQGGCPLVVVRYQEGNWVGEIYP